MPPLYLSGDDVARALPMPRAIAVMREAFRALGEGRVAMPVRIGLHTPRGVTLFMPAHAEGVGLGQKTVSVFSANSEHGLPAIHALVTLFSPESGEPIAVMEGTRLTRIRTGAVTGLACDLLAAPDASVLTLFGAGGQAESQIEAVCSVRPIREVRILSRGRSADHLADRLAALDASRTYVSVDLSRRRHAVEDAEIMVTATTSHEPLMSGAWVRPGAFVAAIGAYRPDMREVDALLLNRSRVFVDQVEAAMAEAGDLLIPMARGEWTREQLTCDLGALVCGHPEARHDSDGVAFFKSCGLAVEDVCAGAAVLDEAERLGFGLRLPA